MGMPTSTVEVYAVNPMINGVDSPQLMSVDSTEPIEIKVEEEKISSDDLSFGEEKKVEVEEEKVKPEEKKEEKEEKKEEEKPVLEPEDSKNVQKRIGKLTKKMRTAEREREVIKAERDSEREKIVELEKKLAATELKSLEGSKPKKADFEEEDAYNEALMDWKVDMKFKSSEKIAEAKVEKKEEKPPEEFEGADELNEALARGREKYDDFEELTSDENLIFPVKLAQVVIELDDPEEIMYYLAQNPEESKRLSSLSSVKAAVEISKLDLEVKPVEEKKEEPKIKKQSKAPEPISSVKTDGAVEKDPEKMTPKEYRAYREGQSK